MDANPDRLRTGPRCYSASVRKITFWLMVVGFALLTTLVITVADWDMNGPEHGIAQWIVFTGGVFLYSLVVTAIAAGFVVGIVLLAYRVWDIVLAVLDVRN